jgi:hypothetical protein
MDNTKLNNVKKILLVIKKTPLFIIFFFNCYGGSRIYILSDSTNSIRRDSITKIARIDAKKHFINKRENRIVIAGAFIATPILGWIIPLYFQKKGINHNKIQIPKSIYSEDQLYINAYREEFFKIRKKKLWITYGLSSLGFIMLMLILYAILLSYALWMLIKFFSNWFTGWFY